MHLGMVFCQVDDGLRNSIDQMKYWHEIMMEHIDTRKKRIREIKKGLSLVPIFGFNIYVIQFSFIFNPLHLSPNQIELCTICIGKKTPTHALK